MPELDFSFEYKENGGGSIHVTNNSTKIVVAEFNKNTEIETIIGRMKDTLRANDMYSENDVYASDDASDKITELTTLTKILKESVDFDEESSSPIAIISKDNTAGTSPLAKNVFIYNFKINLLQNICAQISDQDILLNDTDTSNPTDTVDVAAHNKQQFTNYRTKLLTLLSKNENINGRHRQKVFAFWIWIAFIVILTSGLYLIYSTNLIKDIAIKQIVILSISIIGLIIIVIKKTFFDSKKDSIESFSTNICGNIEFDKYLSDSTGEDPQSYSTDNEAFDGDFNTLNTLLKLHITYRKNIFEDKKGTELAYKNIMKDFENKLYLNIRNYQLIDYKLHDLSSQIELICKGIIIVSLIGIFASVHLKKYISQFLFNMLSLILSVLYSLLILLDRRNKKSRNKYNWNKMYWDIGELKGACMGDSGSKCERGFSIFAD